MIATSCRSRTRDGLGIARHVEERLERLDGGLGVVAERHDASARPVPVADRALLEAERVGDVACDEVRDLARVEAARQLAAHVEQPAELAGEVLRTGKQSRRLERGRSLVGEDRQQPLVLGAELAQPELRERDHADDRPVVAHRDDEHRFVDVVGPGDRRAARVGVGVVHQERLAVQRDPAREALAHLAAQEIEVDIVIGADHALEGDRDDVAEWLDQVHPGVVVVDDAAGLLDDGPPDLFDGVLAVHPGRRRLEDRELGGPRRSLLDEARR